MPPTSATPRTAAGEDTRAALLDASEKLFARHGVDATSLRQITREAGANLASVNYHFGSKEGLVRAVLSRRLAPLNRERLERLERAIEAGGGAVELPELVRAFIEPPLEMIRNDAGGPDFARFVVRAFTEPAPQVREVVREQFAEVVERFTVELARALPQLPADEIYWRFFFLVGAMVHTIGLGFLVEKMSGGICDPLDIGSVGDRLVAFALGGLEQPPAGARP